jgi:hypothetical protein
MREQSDESNDKSAKREIKLKEYIKMKDAKIKQLEEEIDQLRYGNDDSDSNDQ